MTYRIIDNFLDKDFYKQVSEDIKSKEIPWYLRDTIGVAGKTYFTFCYYNNNQPDHSLYNKHILPIIDKLNILSLVQIRSNLTFKNLDVIESDYHTDYDSTKLTTGIFFLTKCNAKNYLKINNKEVAIDNIENRMLLFPTNTMHKVKYQTDVYKRYIINFNFLTNG
jgi:hypothetical protein